MWKRYMCICFRLQKKDRLRGDHSVVLQDEDLKHVIRNYLRRWVSIFIIKSNFVLITSFRWAGHNFELTTFQGADSEAVQNRILGNIEDTHGKLLSRVEDSSQRAVFVKYFILCLSSQKYCAGSFLENDLEEFADNCCELGFLIFAVHLWVVLGSTDIGIDRMNARNCRSSLGRAMQFLELTHCV